MTPAMSRALALHQPIGALKAHPEPDEVLRYRTANVSRSSLLDDSWPHKVAAFRALYLLSQHNNAKIGPLDYARQQLHFSMLFEEWKEFIDASNAGDFAEQVDAVLDWIYVGLGFLSECGFSPEQVCVLMEEVHCSNMTKTDDAGLPSFSDVGKVLKGDNYVKADIPGLIAQMQSSADLTQLGHDNG